MSGQPGRPGDAPAPAGTPTSAAGQTEIVTSPSGAKFRVASEFAPNFRGFLKDYEEAGGKIDQNTSGGLSGRPGNASYHPLGRAIDVNQLSRDRIKSGLPGGIEAEEALAKKWGLRAGSQFSNPDRGHYEVHKRDLARQALVDPGITPSNTKLAGPMPSAPGSRVDNLPTVPQAPGSLPDGALNPNATQLAGGTGNYLAQQRSGLMGELEKNTQLRDEVYATIAKETDNKVGAQAVLESMTNRAIQRGDKSLSQTIRSGFYGPWNRGETQALLRKRQGGKRFAWRVRARCIVSRRLGDEADSRFARMYGKRRQQLCRGSPTLAAQQNKVRTPRP